jgi:hypothetical protein
MTNPIPNPPDAQPSRARAIRSNALRSTGPRTAADKQRSSQNRLTRGLTSHHRALAAIGMHYQRLSRQFHQAVDNFREIQAERAERERSDLKETAELLELRKHKGLPYDPAEHGFVFSMHPVEAFAQRLARIK